MSDSEADPNSHIGKQPPEQPDAGWPKEDGTIHEQNRGWVMGAQQEKSEKILEEQRKEGQHSQPKKRQRTIFEYAGMRSKNQDGGASPKQKTRKMEDPKSAEKTDVGTTVGVVPMPQMDQSDTMDTNHQSEKDPSANVVSTSQQ